MSLFATVRLQLILSAFAACLLIHDVLAEEFVSGKFELIDHHGQTVTERSFDGKLRLVFFGYTGCPDICPTTLYEVSRMMKLLGDDAAQVQPLFVSIDRKNDSLELIASYVGAFHPSMIGLTGSEQQLEAAASAFKVTFGVEHEGENVSGQGSVFHSAYLLLMGKQGEFITVFGYGTKADVMAAKLREYL